MTNIKPGPELDKAVAEAADPYCSVGMCASSGCIDIPSSQVGDTADTDPDVLAVWKWNDERNWRTLPKFSTDLFAAFEAAEVAGLFDYEVRAGYRRCLFRKDANTWCAGGPGLTAEASTPALAICAGILELKKST